MDRGAEPRTFQLEVDVPYAVHSHIGITGKSNQKLCLLSHLSCWLRMIQTTERFLVIRPLVWGVNTHPSSGAGQTNKRTGPLENMLVLFQLNYVQFA